MNRMPKKLACNRRIILTYGEEETITYGDWTIEGIPIWKWLHLFMLQSNKKLEFLYK